MKCPKCKIEFVTKYFDNMPFLYCPDCKAVWLKFPILSKIAKLITKFISFFLLLTSISPKYEL